MSDLTDKLFFTFLVGALATGPVGVFVTVLFLYVATVFVILAFACVLVMVWRG